jgi:hypothetical protein
MLGPHQPKEHQMSIVRISIIAAALVAVSCTSGLAADAYASPKGEIVNKEGKALVKNKFKGKIGALTLESTGGGSVKCTSGSTSGVQSSTTTAEQTTTLSGCKSSLGGSCQTGEAAGIIVIIEHLSTLASRFGMYLTFSVFVVGGLSWECASVKGKDKLQGGFLTPVPIEGKLATSYTFTAAQSKGIQEPTEYENEAKEKVKHVLEGSLNGSEKLEQIGAAGKEEITFEEEAEFV